MTAQTLGKELENIIQESKKKHTELRNAADKSLRDLRSLPSTSEAQLTADLRRRSHFATPFITACKTGSSKLVLSAIISLQRLVVSGGLASERLQEVLDAFLECSNTSHDIQLRVLQSLPSILQNYSDALEGDLQALVLQICTTLQQVKTASVSSTASATLQQVVSSIFDKVETEDAKHGSVPVAIELNLDGKKVRVGSAAHDAFRVLDDLCLLTESQPARFVRGAAISQPFGLELIEAILSNHGEIFDSHEELGHLLRSRVMSLVTRFLSERLTFPVTVRTTRILCIVIREHLHTVQSECEIPLSLLNHLLDSDASNPWRRALCMETFRVIYSTPNLATDVYHLFDQNPNKRNLIQENLAHFVRLAAEKPTLIGVGQQSSFPLGPSAARGSSQDQIVIEAGSVAGVISGELGVSEVNAPGISTQWSSMKTPCLDVLDKSEPPSIPETYVYSLVLSCLNSLSEGLAKTILPLAAQGRVKPDLQLEEPMDSTEDVSTQTPSTENPKHEDKNGTTILDKSRGQSVPINPLTMENHSFYPSVRTIAHIVEECWPAMLATSSTFLFAALDADFYRGLIRSVQKFTQVAGLLRLATPRDAFFTTLAKSAIPPNALKSDGPFSPTLTSSPRIGSGSDGFYVDSPTSRTPSRRGSFDSTSPSLSQRNLMCLRALINLAIVLGSTLDKSWSIIVESLQKADTILAQSGTSTSREYRSNANSGDRQGTDPNSKQSGLNSEITAVEAAVARLLQATAHFPNSAFMHVLRAFCDIAGTTRDPLGSSLTISGGSLRLPRKSPSATTLVSTAVPQARSVHFAISKLGEVARVNINRLAVDPENGGWELLSQKLRSVAASPSVDNTARLMAADVIGSVALGITLNTIDETAEVREEVQLRALASLEHEVLALYENIQSAHEIAGAADFDIHRAALEALRAILEQCGESLIAGWRSIFSILRSTFDSDVAAPTEEDDSTELIPRNKISARPISTKISRSAFACVQLICSDFLDSLKRSRIIILIDILCQFCAQSGDLNISLTTVTLFWNLSDFLQDQLNKELDQKSKNQPMINDSDKESLRKAAEEGSFEALWMILQSQLASMTNDERVDVRNGAVQTVFRILENSGDRLSAKLWAFTFRRVILQMMEINLDSHRKNQSQYGSMDKHDRVKLESTTEMLLQGLSHALSTHLDIVTDLQDFQNIWQAMLDLFSSFLDLGSNEICTSIFDFLTHLLGAAENVDAFGSTTVQRTLVLLEESMPTTTNADTVDALSKEKALVAYVKTLKQIYNLVQERVGAPQIKKIAENLHNCILLSTAPAYTSDIDSMTTLQTQVLDCFEVFRTDLPAVPSTIIQRLAELMTMPYNQSGDESSKRGLTFIAFSKRTTDLLQNIISKHHKTIEIYETGALDKALTALCLAMSFKYHHEKQGKDPSMWQKAITSALIILPQILPEIYDHQNPESAHFQTWLSIGDMKAHIANAPAPALPANEALLADETFDLKANDSLRKCLGIRNSINEHDTSPRSPLNNIQAGPKISIKYVCALFQSSLIHDLGVPIPEQPLRSLYKIRPGSTVDPPFNRRIRMCYQSCDELFALVTAGLNDSENQYHTGGESYRSDTRDPQRGNTDALLPNAAFDYLVLRCALPLRRYIADQPLRGKMPTPTSQRLELLYILAKIRDLNCVVGRDTTTGGGGEGGNGDRVFSVPVLKPWKRHLEWLLPLVNMASVHARRDAEVADAMYGVVDVAFAEAVV